MPPLLLIPQKYQANSHDTYEEDLVHILDKPVFEVSDSVNPCLLDSVGPVRLMSVTHPNS